MHYEVFWLCFIKSLYFSNTIQFRFLSPCGLLASVTSLAVPLMDQPIPSSAYTPIDTATPFKDFFLTMLFMPLAKNLLCLYFVHFIQSKYLYPASSSLLTLPPTFQEISPYFFQFQETNVVYSSLHFLASSPFSQQSTSPFTCFSPFLCPQLSFQNPHRTFSLGPL